MRVAGRVFGRTPVVVNGEDVESAILIFSMFLRATNVRVDWSEGRCVVCLVVLRWLFVEIRRVRVCDIIFSSRSPVTPSGLMLDSLSSSNTSSSELPRPTP